LHYIKGRISQQAIKHLILRSWTLHDERRHQG
jgi:hypothetical protein